MIYDESEPGSWKLALQLGPWRKIGKNSYTNKKDDESVTDRPISEDYRNRAERAEAECQELQEQVDILMEKCRQWKQSTEMVCAIRSDNITLGDLYRAGVTVSFSVE